MKLYVKKATSAKTGKTYTALVLDQNGYQTTLTFDKTVIMKVLNVSPRDLEEMELGNYEIT